MTDICNTSNDSTSFSKTKLPRKRHFRQRAHSNPIADHIFNYPIKPDDVDWSELFPFYFKKSNELDQNVYRLDKTNNDLNDNVNTESNNENKQVEFIDIGCGYGGLLIKLAELYPEKLTLGMEIRVKVSHYVQERIKALRIKSTESNKYQNCACLRMNAMKYLPNYFRKGQLSKIFFLFPDPHFKKQKHKWRIISQQLLGEYAYFLRPDARVYFVTDVKDLYDWMYDHFKNFPLFEELSKEEIEKDEIVPHLFDSSEEGQKVTRNNGEKFFNVFKRIERI